MREPKDVIIRGRTLEDILKEHAGSRIKIGSFKYLDPRSELKMEILDLRYADLEEVNLSNADLYAANLEGANLHCANLNGSTLYDCNLRSANLSFANLSDAQLSNANMIASNLSHANLMGADLSYTNMCWSTMSDANLQEANLSYANLSRVTMHGVQLKNTILTYANLANAIGISINLRKGKILTEDLIGYKKCLSSYPHADYVIVTLKIPKGAIVFSINGKKYRTNKAKVIAIENGDKAISYYNSASYYVGDEITVNNFNCQYNIECSAGIHFFKSKEEAEEYNFN